MGSGVLLLRGGQGAGKSTLARHIAEKHGFCMLSKDDLFVPGMGEIEDSRTASRIAYQSMARIIHSNRLAGLNFVVDAPLREAADVARWTQDIESWGYVARSVLLYCGDDEQWDSRLRQREGAGTPNHLVTSLAELRARGDDVVQPVEGELRIDTSRGLGLDAMAQLCVDRVRSLLIARLPESA